MDSANIILGYKNPVIPTPAEMENEKLTINTLKNQNAASQRQMQMQKELEGITDPNQAVAVISKYDPIKGMEMRQKMQEQAQSQSKDKRAMAVEGIGFYGKQAGIISNIYDDSIKAGLTPEQAQQKVMPLFQNAMSQGAHLYPDLPVSGDFDIDKIKQSAMQADDFLKQYNESKLHLRDRSEKALDTADEREYQTLKTKQANNFDLSKIEVHRLNDLEKLKIQNNFTAGQNAASRAVTMRGQNMTKETSDTRAREKEASGGKSEKLTEGMRSTGQYAERMSAAEKLLEQTTEQKPSIKESIMGLAGETAANLSRSEDRQKSLQAQRDWVRAKLRKESGAAIGVDEMKNEITTYFPQIGDSAGVIAQKKQARQQAVDGMISAAGGAYTEPNQPIKTGTPILDKNSPAAQMPKKGTIKGGYVFLGGDPANPKSWKAK